MRESLEDPSIIDQGEDENEFMNRINSPNEDELIAKKMIQGVHLYSEILVKSKKDYHETTSDDEDEEE